MMKNNNACQTEKGEWMCVQVGGNKWACRLCKWKHKCTCMGENLVGHACGRVWVFGCFSFYWALRFIIFLGNWAYIG